MRALSRFLIVTFCAFVSAPVDATAQWVQAYGGEGVSSFYSIQQTADGGYVAAGETGLGGGFANAWVVKVDAGANIVWQKIFGGPGDEYAWSVHPTVDGGYIVAGKTDWVGAGQRDAWLMKLDASGTPIWQETFGGRDFEALLSVQPTPDGGYLAVGRTNSFGAGSTDAWLLKLDASGRVAWQRTIGDKGGDAASSVSPTSDGGYIVAGETNSYGWGGADAWVLKLDANGSILWQSAYGGARDEYANSVQSTADGGYIVAGYTSTFGAGGSDAWVLKLDGSGNVVWQKTYGGAGNEAALSIAPIAGGGYVLAGYTSSFGAAGGDAWVLRLTRPATSSGKGPMAAHPKTVPTAYAQRPMAVTSSRARPIHSVA